MGIDLIRQVIANLELRKTKGGKASRTPAQDIKLLAAHLDEAIIVLKFYAGPKSTTKERREGLFDGGKRARLVLEKMGIE